MYASSIDPPTNDNDGRDLETAMVAGVQWAAQISLTGGATFRHTLYLPFFTDANDATNDDTHMWYAMLKDRTVADLWINHAALFL